MAGKMKSGIKFSCVDVLAFMGSIVQKHTKYYRSDFELDKSILLEAADSREQYGRTFIWLCRTHGTWCLCERNVLIKDTRENNTFNFYIEQTREPVLAFAVEVIRMEADSVLGNVYVLDYRSHYDHVCSISLSQPYSQEELQALLWKERKNRERYKEGNPDRYITELQNTVSGE